MALPKQSVDVPCARVEKEFPWMIKCPSNDTRQNRLSTWWSRGRENFRILSQMDESFRKELKFLLQESAFG